MAQFDFHLTRLIETLDAQTWSREVATLQRCRTVDDLRRIVDGGGWLTAGSRDPRLKLVRHLSGTYLVVKYDDGWTTTMGMEPFP